MSYYETFIREIVKMSQANTWAEAKFEWEVQDIAFVKNSSCLCGKYPIREVINMHNHQTNNLTQIGNCCVKKFFDDSEWSKVFSAIKRGKVNEKLIMHAYQKKVINDWERDFMLDVWRKQIMSGKQREKYKNINQKIIERFSK